MTQEQALRWLVAFLKNIGTEIGRAHAHWFGAGAGVFAIPNGKIAGCKFQAVVDEGIKQGLISKRRTAKGRVFLKSK